MEPGKKRKEKTKMKWKTREVCEGGGKVQLEDGREREKGQGLVVMERENKVI